MAHQPFYMKKPATMGGFLFDAKRWSI